MPSLTCFNQRFTYSYVGLILAFMVVSILVSLGFWQLKRADEKNRLLAEAKNLTTRATRMWSPGDNLPEQYETIKIRGRFLENIILLDNQYHEHQAGYDVLSPLQTLNNKIILIDQGWLAIENRRQLPKLEMPAQQGFIEGYVYYPSKKTFLLGSPLERSEDKIAVIESIDTKLVSNLLHKSVYPFIIRINRNEDSRFIRQWPIVVLPPSRHYAYAVQWFAMALAAVIGFIALSKK